jgi:hypothetical protein
MSSTNLAVFAVVGVVGAFAIRSFFNKKEDVKEEIKIEEANERSAEVWKEFRRMFYEIYIETDALRTDVVNFRHEILSKKYVTKDGNIVDFQPYRTSYSNSGPYFSLGSTEVDVDINSTKYTRMKLESLTPSVLGDLVDDHEDAVVAVFSLFDKASSLSTIFVSVCFKNGEKPSAVSGYLSFCGKTRDTVLSRSENEKIIDAIERNFVGLARQFKKSQEEDEVFRVTAYKEKDFENVPYEIEGEENGTLGKKDLLKFLETVESSFYKSKDERVYCIRIFDVSSAETSWTIEETGIEKAKHKRDCILRDGLVHNFYHEDKPYQTILKAEAVSCVQIFEKESSK